MNILRSSTYDLIPVKKNLTQALFCLLFIYNEVSFARAFYTGLLVCKGHFDICILNNVFTSEILIAIAFTSCGRLKHCLVHHPFIMKVHLHLLLAC